MIFLRSSYVEDSVIWIHTYDGICTIKSGYRLALNISSADDDPNAPLALEPDISKEIWKEKVAQNSNISFGVSPLVL